MFRRPHGRPAPTGSSRSRSSPPADRPRRTFRYGTFCHKPHLLCRLWHLTRVARDEPVSENSSATASGQRIVDVGACRLGHRKRSTRAKQWRRRRRQRHNRRCWDGRRPCDRLQRRRPDGQRRQSNRWRRSRRHGRYRHPRTKGPNGATPSGRSLGAAPPDASNNGDGVPLNSGATPDRSRAARGAGR